MTEYDTQTEKLSTSTALPVVGGYWSNITPIHFKESVYIYND